MTGGLKSDLAFAVYLVRILVRSTAFVISIAASFYTVDRPVLQSCVVAAATLKAQCDGPGRVRVASQKLDSVSKRHPATRRNVLLI